MIGNSLTISCPTHIFLLPHFAHCIPRDTRRCGVLEFHRWSFFFISVLILYAFFLVKQIIFARLHPKARWTCVVLNRWWFGAEIQLGDWTPTARVTLATGLHATVCLQFQMESHNLCCKADFMTPPVGSRFKANKGVWRATPDRPQQHLWQRAESPYLRAKLNTCR